MNADNTALLVGETVVIQSLVHNHFGKDVEAEVVMRNEEGEFQFLDPEAGDEKWVQLVIVPVDEIRSIFFKVSSLVFGNVELALKARCELAGDAVTQYLIVRPPGLKKVRNKAALLSLNPDDVKTKVTLKTDFPERRVREADFVTASLMGDLLGPELPNLQNLIQMPIGCGEQNMVRFVLNIVVLNYLALRGSLSPETKAKALRFLEAGYQRQLTFAYPDGSFSAFGTRDEAGSTWLTAFVVRSLHAARPYMQVEERVIKAAVRVLASRQIRDGSFVERQELVHRELAGGVEGRALALSAYTLLALVETLKTKNRSGVIEKGFDYLLRGQSLQEDPYVLALTTYALSVARHPRRQEFMKKLEAMAVMDGDKMHWGNESSRALGVETDRKSVV